MLSWDTVKAAANLEKHRISFEEAATVFSDAEGLDLEDLEHSTREPRSRGLGGQLSEEF
jgi:uncharacterized DUF497 family protein